MGEFQINLVCCTSVICDEVKSGASQKSVAATYALAIKSAAQKADEPDWKTINTAIIERWNFKALDRIKGEAFRILNRAAKAS
jgi:hypothetical protein